MEHLYSELPDVSWHKTVEIYQISYTKWHSHTPYGFINSKWSLKYTRIIHSSASQQYFLVWNYTNWHLPYTYYLH
jgi:hypothetical protein